MYVNPTEEEQKVISYILSKTKKFVPSSCGIRDTFFTYMGIVGNINERTKEISN